MIADLREAAERFAGEAGRLTLRHFGSSEHTIKADGTPVTPGDREAEELLRTRIEAAFPSHGILGEEFGETHPDAPVRWIIDPIDGTKSYLRGVPLYAVLIGVEIEGRPQVGVAHFPALGETVSAAVGAGCSWNGATCGVSRTDRLEDALVLTTDERAIRSSRLANGWRRLVQRSAVCRGWGDAWGHILVATGRAEVMVDPMLASWDAAPLLPIVQEAGGTFTTVSGQSTIHGGSGVSTNGLLHETVLAELGG